jgi:hypothetical protein
VEGFDSSKREDKKMCPYQSTKTGAPASELRFDFRHMMSESDVGTRFSFV